MVELHRVERDGRLSDAMRDYVLRAAVFAAAADACLRCAAKVLRRPEGSP